MSLRTYANGTKFKLIALGLLEREGSRRFSNTGNRFNYGVQEWREWGSSLLGEEYG
jgi:hypothetical protein